MSKRPWGQVVDKQGSAVKDFISNYYKLEPHEGQKSPKGQPANNHNTQQKHRNPKRNS